MRFTYEIALVQSAVTGEADAILRPELPVRLIGPKRTETFQGLLDSGSDNTILPRSVADALGLERRPSLAVPSVAFGGQPLPTQVADVEIELTRDDQSCRWTTPVNVIDITDTEGETVILGFTGFLEFFRVQLDPEYGVIDLEPNSLHPSTIATGTDGCP